MKWLIHLVIVLRNLSSSLAAKHYWVVALWLILTLLAAIYFIGARVQAFDPHQKLTNLSDKNLVAQIIEDFYLPAKTRHTLIHFTDNRCQCNQVSAKHIRSLSDVAQQYSMDVLTVNVTQSSSSIIPALPAVMAIDDTGKLLYFGPYAQGIQCSENSEYVETVLANYDKGYPSTTILSEAKGCYCPT